MKKVLAFMMMAIATAGILVPTTLVSATDARGPGDGDAFGTANRTTGMGVTGSGEAQGSSLLTTVKTFINWTLGMLSLIALVVLLWGGFQMITAAGDENKYKKGFTILKQAAMGLVIIGLSWLFVSLIFWLIGSMSGKSTTGGSGL